MRLLTKFAQWKWGRWWCNSSSFMLATIVFQIVIRVEAVGSAEYRTFDLRNDGRGQMSMRRSDNNEGELVRSDMGTFSSRRGPIEASTDIRGRYWSKTRRDPEYTDDQEDAPLYTTVNQNGDEVNQDACDSSPCIAFDRVDLDRQHSFTINMPRMEGKNHIFKKFVVQPVIQYVMQYDRDSKRREREEQAAASTNYQDYEGSQGQNKMRRSHEEGIDRFFNDINAKFEGYWGDDESVNGGQGQGQGGYGGGGGGSGGGYEGGSTNSGDWGGGNQDGNSGGNYNSGGNEANYNNGGGGGSGIDFGFGFGSDGRGGGGSGYDTNNNGNNQLQQQDINGFVSAGAYGPPGMTPGGPSQAPMSSMAGSSDGGNNNGGGGAMSGDDGNGMSLSNAAQMSTSQQGDMQMSDMGGNFQGGGNSIQMNMGMGGGSSTSSMASAGGIMGMGQVGMNQAFPGSGMGQASAVPSHGMGMMMQHSPPMSMPQQMPMSSVAPPPTPLYGVPGMAPGQPLGPMGFMQQQNNNQFQQGMQMSNAVMGMAVPQPHHMHVQTPTMQSVMGGGMSAPMSPTVGDMTAIGGNQMGGFNQQMMRMMGGGSGISGAGMMSGVQNTQINSGSSVMASNLGNFFNTGTGNVNQMTSNNGGRPMFQNTGMSSFQGNQQQSIASSSASSLSSSSSSTSSDGSSASSDPRPEYGPPKQSNGKGSASSSESQTGSKEEGYESSKERPSRPSRGKKPSGGSGGGGSKPKGRGRGRGRKSLFSSLPSLPKIPASIGGHLSFMFSTGFGKNRKGRNGSGGGSKPGDDSKSKQIGKEQVSDHILNILGLTVHHPPGHATNNASDYSSTNPIVLWEQHGNSTNLTQLASHLPGDTQGDIAAHLPLVEIEVARESKSAKLEKTEDDPIVTTTEVPTTTAEISTTLRPQPSSSSTFPTKTVVKNVTLAQAIAISTLHFNFPRPDYTTEPEPSTIAPLPILPTTITSLPILPTTITTASSPPPPPIFTTSPRPLIPPPTPKDTRSRFRFRKPKNLPVSPQAQFFPEPIATYFTPPPPPPSSTPVPFEKPTRSPPPSSLPSQSSFPKTPYDPLQDFINQNLSNNMLTLNDPDIVSSIPISTPSQLIHRPKIEAYYAEADMLQNPIKLIQFDPLIYDALQAAFQPYDGTGTYFGGELRKRKRSWERPQPFNFLPSIRDVRSRNKLLGRNQKSQFSNCSSKQQSPS